MLFRYPGAALVVLLRRAANALLRLIAKLLWPFSADAAPQTICIFRIGNIGDVLCALPAMRAIRCAYPDARLILLSSPGPRGLPGAQELLSGADWLDEQVIYFADEISSWPGRRALLNRMRAMRIDLWVDLSSEIASLRRLVRDMLFARLAGARHACGWELSSICQFARAQSKALNFPNEVDRLLSMVHRCGVHGQNLSFGLPLTERHHLVAQKAIHIAGLEVAELVAIAPGAKRETNRWSLDDFVEVGKVLARNAYGIVLLGGESERSECDAIAQRIGAQAVSFAGRLDLLSACAMLERCKILVCVDSGVQHMAAAVGTPCVAVTSAREFPGKWAPAGASNKIFRLNLPCQACLLDICPKDNACMKGIAATDVAAMALALLRAS